MANTGLAKTGLVVIGPSGRFRLARGRRDRAACQEGLSRQDRLPVLRRARREPVRLEEGRRVAGGCEGRPQATRRSAPRQLLGAEIEFFDAGDYPLRTTTETHFDRMVDIYRELKPSFVLTHALEDPYNFDHPQRRAFRAGGPRRRAGGGPQAGRDIRLRRAAGVPVRAAPARACATSSRNVILNIDEVWEEQAQGVRDPRRAEASLGLLRARRAQPRHAGRPQLRQADDLWRGLSAAVPDGVEELA